LIFARTNDFPASSVALVVRVSTCPPAGTYSAECLFPPFPISIWLFRYASVRGSCRD
jgi:hypothetical protein